MASDLGTIFVTSMGPLPSGTCRNRCVLPKTWSSSWFGLASRQTASWSHRKALNASAALVSTCRASARSGVSAATARGQPDIPFLFEDLPLLMQAAKLWFQIAQRLGAPEEQDAFGL